MKRRHVNQVHEGMKPYQCEQSDCGRSFTSKSGLDRHITDHTGEFPFICPECPKKFKVIFHLYRMINLKEYNELFIFYLIFLYF